MKHLRSILLVCLFATVIIASCKKDTEETPAPVSPVTPASPPTSGSLILHFDNMVGNSALILNNSYTTANNDTFTVSTFKYYISNIKLMRSDSTIFSESNSYHLVNAANVASGNVSISNVPFGKYIGISFMIGVDSARNVSGAQTGALDPINDMFWNWSTGYIMAKLEGTSPQSTAAGNAITYKIIGFSGAYNVLKTISPSLNNDTARVSVNVVPKIYLKTDLLEWFETPTTISISTLNTIVLSGADAKTISDNYADMISYDHLNN